MARARRQVPQVGETRHHLTTVEPPHTRTRANGQREWWVDVRCDACPQRTVKAIRVTDFGNTTSCGCLKGGKGLVRDITNVVTPGQVFNRLTVIEEVRVNGKRVARCRCSCPAQTVKDVMPGHLYSGAVKSCGCYNREVARERMLARESPRGQDHPNYKHGLALKLDRHPHYNRWESMMSRCYREADSNYENYGAVGITVYEPWHDVVTFVHDIEQLLGPCPDGHTMDRIDVFGPYHPDNLRWASAGQQSANRRNSKKQLFRAAAETTEMLRQEFPGHSVEWYIAFMKRASWQLARRAELPDLPEV